MKKNVLFFLFLTIFCFILTDEIFAEYVWTQYNNSTGYNINSIKFNESFGVMVGDNGIIKTSSNDGLTWINQNSGCEERLNDVFIENNNLIVAVGSNRRVLISQDSGVTWINRPPVNVSGTTEFYSVSVNNSVIWITGSSSLIFKSSDFGQTWEKQYEGSRDIKFIKIFSSGNHGVSIGENILLTTSDGGSNWLPVIPITGTLNFTTGFCLNDYLWFGITNNGDGTYSLYQTFEGPSRWIFLYKFDFAVKSITFINYYSGFAVGENGNIYYTQDNPSIWQKIDIDTSITVNLNSVSFTDSGETIWVSGNNGYYYKRFYEYGELEPQTQEIIADAGGKYFVLKNDTVQLTSEKTIARNKNFLRYSWSAEDADVILSDQDKILCNFESGTSGKYRIKLKVDDYRGHFGEDYAEIYVVDTYSQISSPFSEISVTGNNTGLMLNDYVHTIDLKLESVTSVYNASLYFDLKNFRSVPHLFIANKIEPSFFNEVRPNISLFDDLSYTA
ncbi:hypothetical protein KA977_12505, partial [Candidatus Dependentiae bacterium]|nr:hypothetical protein [Candidatus Dependentiae bacterium]